ncbi:hypothetical protein ABPG74_004776 [Tetrahymena malaccensis]
MGCKNSQQKKKLGENVYSEKKSEENQEVICQYQPQPLNKSCIKSFTDLQDCSDLDQITKIDLKPTLNSDGDQIIKNLLNFTHLNSVSLDFSNFSLEQNEFKNLFQALQSIANLQKLQLNLWMSQINDNLLSELALTIRSQQNLIYLSINLIENQKITQYGMKSLYQEIAYCKNLSILKIVTPVSVNNATKSLNDLGNLIQQNLINLKELYLTIKCCQGVQNLINLLSKTKSITYMYLNLQSINNLKEFETQKYYICKSRRLTNIKILI